MENPQPRQRISPVTIFLLAGGCGLLLLILGMFLAIVMPNFNKARNLAKQAQSKASVHILQMGLERYAVDNKDKYPEKLHDLIQQGYLGAYPSNPFADREMEEMPWGQWSAGDFSYWVSKDAKAYCVVGYGYEKTNAVYQNGIVIVLLGGKSDADSRIGEDNSMPDVCRKEANRPRSSGG